MLARESHDLDAADRLRLADDALVSCTSGMSTSPGCLRARHSCTRDANSCSAVPPMPRS